MVQFTVSVFMLTYNQECFIAQAINGVLMQKSNFAYQLVIGEDCSTDDTYKICENFALAYPSKIKLLPKLDLNIGLIANYMRTIKECDGKFIAICDGDDYWTDVLKLQKQVDFLELNPDYAIVGSNLKKLYANGEMIASINRGRQETYEFDDLIFANLLPSVTAVFKNITIEEPLPSWILNFPYGDWPTYLWTIRNGGKIHLLGDITAVYRMDIGVSSKMRIKNSNIIKANLLILDFIFSDLNFAHKKDIIKISIERLNGNLMTSYNRERKYISSIKLLFQNLSQSHNKRKIIKIYFYSLKKSIKSILLR
ncbi:glycosyltransferase [Flavobacterium antarcticum]|uniref:glycosyltransferase n=1 Tax=Flavobacterium antarcticum TaxID=271155 RepID=UPI0003B30CBD|nr:glycosyltransferase [Flavobacterium antarcticum]